MPLYIVIMVRDVLRIPSSHNVYTNNISTVLRVDGSKAWTVSDGKGKPAPRGYGPRYILYITQFFRPKHHVEA